MSDDTAPERIWAWSTGVQSPAFGSGLWRSEMVDAVEYVRADLGSFYQEKDIDALQARIAALEAERDMLREAVSERLMSVAREYEKAFDETFSDHHRAALAQTARELRRQAAALKETDT